MIGLKIIQNMPPPDNTERALGAGWLEQAEFGWDEVQDEMDRTRRKDREEHAQCAKKKSQRDLN